MKTKKMEISSINIGKSESLVWTSFNNVFNPLFTVTFRFGYLQIVRLNRILNNIFSGRN